MVPPEDKAMFTSTQRRPQVPAQLSEERVTAKDTAAALMRANANLTQTDPDAAAHSLQT